MTRYAPTLLLLFILAAVSAVIYDRGNLQTAPLKAALTEAKEAQAKAAQALEEGRSKGKEEVQVGQAVQRFLTEWNPHVAEANAGPAQVSSTLSNLARKHNLISSRGTAGLKENYQLAGVNTPVMRVEFGVAGTYPQVMKWLGEVEEEFAFGRIESLVMQPPQGGSSDVELNIAMVFLADKGAAQ